MSTPSSTHTPRGSGTSPWLVLILVCFAQFMVVLDATIVNVALPSIQRSLHFSPASLQWIVNSYTLVFGGFLLLGGRAADLIGRKRLFLAGVAVFSVASLLNALAPSGSFLIASRGLQGLGGALVAPAALSIITTTFAEGEMRTRALAVWAGVAAGGGAFGLLLGGILTDTLSWKWIFLVNVPIGVVAFLLSLRFVPESRVEGGHRTFDLAGAAAVTAGLVVLVYAIVKAQAYGWTSARTLGLTAIALVLLAAFGAIERQSKAPLVRLDIFLVRSLASANTVMLLVAGGLFSMFFFASLYVQEILGYSPLRAGFAFLPVTAGIIAGSGVAAQLIRRIGVRAQVVIGLGVAALGLALLTRITPGGTYVGELLPGLVVMSIGMGLTFVPLTLIATTNVVPDDAGLASGLFNTAQQVGGSLGLAILSTVAASRTSDLLGGGARPSGAAVAGALVDGYTRAFSIAAVLVAAGALIILLLVRRADVAKINPEQIALEGGPA
jgi:EmrB/QacA subfamily drug resistance transporter